MCYAHQLGGGGHRFKSRQPSSKGHTAVNECSSAKSFRSQFTGHLSWEVSPHVLQLKSFPRFSTTFCFSTQPNVLYCSCWFPYLWMVAPWTVRRLLKEDYLLPVSGRCWAHRLYLTIGERVGEWILSKYGHKAQAPCLCISEKRRSNPEISEIVQVLKLIEMYWEPTMV